MDIYKYPVTTPFGKVAGYPLNLLVPRNPALFKLGGRREIFTLEHNSLSFINIRMFCFRMLSSTSIQFKVIRMIIGGVVVNVVDHFSQFKNSTNLFFHNYAMLCNIALFTGIRMVWAIKIPIARPFNPTAFISRGVLAFYELSSFISKHSLSVSPCSIDVKGSIC